MDIAQTQRKIERLEADHKRLSAQDTLLWAKGELSEEDFVKRRDARLAEIASLGLGTQHFEKAIELEAVRQSNKDRRLRWHRFTEHAMRRFPYYHDLDLTKSEKAVIVALMMAAGGQTRFEVANDWIVKKAGVSLASVRRAIKRFVGAGLLSKTERRLKGKAMNLWNVYKLKCAELAEWASAHYFIKGVKIESHPQKGDYFEATEELKKQTSEPEITNEVSCRQKAGQSMRPEAPEAIDPETFALLASGALRELGLTPDDNATESHLLSMIDEARAARQPNFKPFIWESWGLRKHGARKTALAFLHTQLVKAMRSVPIPDERPWNEREPVRSTDRYLASILKLNGDDCRPDLSIAQVLLSKQIYEIPENLVRASRKRASARKKLKRSDCSSDMAFT